MQNELDQQVAIVTGSAKNIGRAIADRLAGMGAAVVIKAKSSREDAEAAAAAIKERGGRAIVAMADLTDEAAVQGMVDQTLEAFGRLDILVNNAALRRDAPISEISYADWRAVTSSILDAAFLCTKAAEPHLDANGAGTIVNIGGVAGHAGVGGRAHVVAAKAGISGLTKGLASEFAPRGITVNCVSPGYVGTKRDHIPPHFQARPVPMGRPAEPAELADAVAFLCSPRARYITGQTLQVNGGWWMG
jgi:3-oxoacyl-[acyl-carrier protein] reductase